MSNRIQGQRRLNSLLAARAAVATVFFFQGILFASWVARIPAFQQKIGLGSGALGWALLGKAIGAMCAMPLTGTIIVRFGSRRVTRMAALTSCLALSLPAFSFSLFTLFLAFTILGANSGAMSVAMNTQAVAVEQQYGRRIMASFHAMFSLGGMIGALSGAVAASQGISVATHLFVTAVVLATIAMTASRWLLIKTEEQMIPRKFFWSRPPRALLGLGAIAFCVLLGEGAMSDWSAVYLREVFRVSAGRAAVGYAVFSLAMATGRILGDRVIQQWGPFRVVRFGSTIAAVGLGMSLLTDTPVMAYGGMACVGAGFSCIIPIVFSAVGRTEGVTIGPALAAVTTTGYVGFLAGPPLIGLASEVATLRGGLSIVVALSVAIALLARSVSPPTGRSYFARQEYQYSGEREDQPVSC